MKIDGLIECTNAKNTKCFMKGVIDMKLTRTIDVDIEKGEISVVDTFEDSGIPEATMAQIMDSYNEFREMMNEAF